ncbi:MAG: hypothetical protein Q9165_003366 [Trypethelium subeluteriae]
MPLSSLTPLSTLRVSRHQIPALHLIPNTSLAPNRPLLIYHSVFPRTVTPSAIESHLTTIGTVVPAWRYTMYSTTHFHSTAHEVLCISSGKARLCFGGEENPGRVEEVVERGDVVIVPAGVGHRLLEDLAGGFEMVGSYEKGKSWDMCYGKKGEEDKVEQIKGLSWFRKDPVYGDDGPAVK